MSEMLAIIWVLLTLWPRSPGEVGNVFPLQIATPQSKSLPSPPGEDLTCSDFATQAEAQSVLDADSSDPYGLDVDLDGIACETPLVAPADNRDALDDRTARRATRTGARAAATPRPPIGEDIDCIDFAFQEDAQTVYDQYPGDPYNLDPSGDGLACSSLPSRPPT